MESNIKHILTTNFLWVRSLIAIGMVILHVFIQLLDSETDYNPIFIVILVYLVLTHVLHYTHRNKIPSQLILQIATITDLILVTFVTRLTGGVSSPYFVGYFSVMTIAPFIINYENLTITFFSALFLYLCIQIDFVFDLTGLSTITIPSTFSFIIAGFITFCFLFLLAFLTKIFFRKYNILSDQINHTSDLAAKLSNEISLNQAIFNASKDGILITDDNGKIVRYNSSSIRKFAIQPQAITTVSFYDLVSDASTDGSALDFSKRPSLKEWTALNYFDAKIGISGRQNFDARISIAPFRFEGNDFFVVTMRDRTDQKRNEELKESLYNFSHLLNSAQSEDQLYASILPGVKRILTCTDSFLYVRSADDVFTRKSSTGVYTSDFWAENLTVHLKHHAEFFRKINQVKDVCFFDANSELLKSGTIRKQHILLDNRLLIIIPFFIEENLVAFTATLNNQYITDRNEIHQLSKLIMVDVTLSISKFRLIQGLTRANEQLLNLNENQEKLIYERTQALHAASNELQLQYNEIKRTSKFKDDFLATMSHELRTPLNSILGFSQLTLESGSENLTEIQSQNIRKVVKNAHILLGMINEVLDLTKLETGEIKLIQRPINLHSLVEKSTHYIKPLIAMKDIVLHIVPLNSVDEFVSDAHKISRIINNFLSNAVKFTEKGVITISYGTFDNEIMISVKDTGMGIPAESQTKIFDRFVQLDTSDSRKFGGAGLGLTICRKLADVIEARIEVESEVGHGSNFKLFIPLQNKKIQKVV